MRDQSENSHSLSPTIASPGEFGHSVEIATHEGRADKPANEHSTPPVDDNQGDIDKVNCARYLSSVVTECLDSHRACSGFYTDCEGKYILKCSCSCHIQRGGRNPSSTPQCARDQVKGSFKSNDPE
jgi:hypothetical protein